MEQMSDILCVIKVWQKTISDPERVINFVSEILGLCTQ
jgi:hypothetical protein